MTLTNPEIVARALAGWPYNTVPYSQSQIWNDDDGSGPHIGGYRMDCSGFASMAAGLPAPGLSTVTFVTTNTIHLITWAELTPGDFVGACGPGTAGDAGHIMVVIAVNRAANTYTVLEQAGYGAGPDRNTYTIGDGQGRNYLPYRLGGSVPVTPATIAPGAPFPLTGNNVFGDINGPDMVHGGDPAYDSTAIVAAVGGIQAALVDQGYAGQVNKADWVDCRFEQPTTDAVKRLQAAKGLPQTGLVDAATWAALFPAPAAPPAPPVVNNTVTVDVDALVAALKPVIEAAIAAEVAKLRLTIAT